MRASLARVDIRLGEINDAKARRRKERKGVEEKLQLAAGD